MNKEERATYEGLVIESLKEREKDYSQLVEDARSGWVFINMKKRMRNPNRPIKLIKQELSTEISPSMVDNEIITLGVYGLYSLREVKT